MKRVVAPSIAALIVVLAGPAQAEIEALDVRLTLEGSLLNWSKREATNEDGSETNGTLTNAGLLSGGYVAIGLAAHRYLLPTLFMGLQQRKYEEAGGASSQTVRDWDLRPTLEVPLLSGSRLVPFVNAGMSLVRTVSRFETQIPPNSPIDPVSESKSFRLGPAVGVGLHGFIVEQASLDISLTYCALFLAASERSFASPEQERRDHTLLLNLGASFWL